MNSADDSQPQDQAPADEDFFYDLLAEIYSESCGNVYGTALKARYHFECIYNMEKISFGSVF